MKEKFKELKLSKERRTIAGVIVAAIAASVCCVGPLVLLALGVGGAWAGNLTALEPFRPYIMAITLLILGYAFYKIYRRPKQCAPGSYCANPKSDKVNKILLWFSTAFVAILFAIPYATPHLSARQNKTIEQAGVVPGTIHKVVLEVPGMSCPACPFTVQKSLTKMAGVISAEVSFENKTAVVKYDSSKVTVRQMIMATTDVGYPSRVVRH